MTSVRANRANQKNADVSTGPRTAAGKKRSSQNARKHGLSVISPSIQAADEATFLFDVLFDEVGSDPALREAAQAVAEAHIHLKHVFACKRALVEVKARDPMVGGGAVGTSGQAGVTLELLEALESLERYERRAFSRRQTAIRRFRFLTRNRAMAGSE